MKLLEIHLFHFHDLLGLHGRRPADDGQVAAPEFLHGLEASLVLAALADDGPDSVFFHETGRKPVHPSAGRGPHADLLPPVPHLSSSWGRCGAGTPPCRETGGSFLWSKIWISVRSRIPKIVPFRVTISRTLSFRTTSSVKGVFNVSGHRRLLFIVSVSSSARNDSVSEPVPRSLA